MIGSESVLALSASEGHAGLTGGARGDEVHGDFAARGGEEDVLTALEAGPEERGVGGLAGDDEGTSAGEESRGGRSHEGTTRDPSLDQNLPDLSGVGASAELGGRRR